MRINKLTLWILALILLVTTVQGALIDGLITYYTMDNADTSGTIAIDKLNTYNGTLTGAGYTSGAVGILGQAYDSTGSGNRLVTNIVTSLLQSGDTYTLNLWVYADTLAASGNNRGFFGCFDGANNGLDFLIRNVSAEKSDQNISAYFNPSGFVYSTQVLPSGSWHMVTYANDGSNKLWYYDGVLIRNMTNSYIDCTTAFVIGAADSAGTAHYWDGKNDEFGYWNRALSNTEIGTGAGSLYNSGLGFTYPFTAGGTGSNFSITATDEWNSSSLNITVWIGASSYGPNTTVTTDILSNSSSLYNVTIGASGYFNRTYLNQNVSSNLAGTLHQAEVCFNATAKVSNASVTPNNFTIGTNSSASCFNITAGSHNVMAQKSGWFNQNQTFSVTALSNTTQTVQNLSYANLTISAKDGTTNASLTGYNLTITSLNWSWSGETATAVTNHSFYLVNGTYNVIVSMPGYANTTAVANVTVSGHTNYTFTLYKSNSVSITIRDEITGNIITDNVTVRWSDNSTTWENVTSTGQLFVHNITATNYTLLFYSSNYSTRTYTITVGPSSTQFLTAYMISSTYSTIFTIKDIDTGDILDGASITMYKLINSTWTTVESKTSDISGKAQFYYDPIANYRFYLANTDYNDYVFYLNPILFPTYDVFMTKTSVLNYSVDFDDISFIYSPTSFNNNENTTMNFLISSPSGTLTNYGIKVTYPGGTDSASGVNAIGEQLSVDVNVTGATAFDYVVLEFNYTTSLSGERTYIFNLPINVNVSSGTWLTNKDKTYGLGIFERMLIATIIILFIVGIATMVGQALPGIALGMFVFMFLVFIGFVPLWVILPSMLIGVLFLVWKSGGY